GDVGVVDQFVRVLADRDAADADVGVAAEELLADDGGGLGRRVAAERNVNEPGREHDACRRPRWCRSSADNGHDWEPPSSLFADGIVSSASTGIEPVARD